MDLEQIRSTLEAQLQDVLAKHGRLQDHLRNKDRILPNDWPELAQVVGNDEVLEALEQRSRARAEDLQRAIERIDAGAYAQCVNCGTAIDPRRLSLLPATAVCAGCAS